MFFLGFKAIQLGFHFKGFLKFLGYRSKSSDFKNGFFMGFDVCAIFYSKILSCMVGISRFPKSNFSPSSSELKNIEGNVTSDFDSFNHELLNESSQVEDDEEEDENDEGDEEMDIEALRKAIKIEKQRTNAAYLELEEERKSAIFAANETMAMISRLQNEKSSIEIEANQYRRLVEEKQQYDQEVIRYLRWIISKQESERRILESQLKLCRQKLQIHFKNDEGEQVLEELDQIMNSYCSTIEENDDLTDGLMSSFDMEDFSLM